MSVVKVGQDYILANRTAGTPSITVPYGSIATNDCKELPQGIFCVYNPQNGTVWPSVHGIRVQKLQEPIRVCLLMNPGRLHGTFDYLIGTTNSAKILNTGLESLCPGDTFTVTLPTEHDCELQRKHLKQHGSVCGGLLAVKKVQPFESDLIRQIAAAATNGSILAQMTCPATLEKVHSYCALLRSVALTTNITAQQVAVATEVLTGGNVNVADILTVLSDQHVKTFMSYVLVHAKAMLSNSQGFVVGEVLFADSGAKTRPIAPGEYFIGSIYQFV